MIIDFLIDLPGKIFNFLWTCGAPKPPSSRPLWQVLEDEGSGQSLNLTGFTEGDRQKAGEIARERARSAK
ncbi:MAG: hypothetical protein V4467_03435 [Patescibacteria group bacterium]